MPLTTASLNATFAFSLFETNVGFPQTTMGPGVITFNLNDLVIPTIANQCFAIQYNMAPSATHTLDLTSLTNQVFDVFAFGHVSMFILTTVGNEITISPGASNPLQWFFGGTTQSIVVPAGGLFVYSGDGATTGTVVDATHKTIKITATGATTNANPVRLAILGTTL